MKTIFNKKGFTLIELLVVIGILAILFSIVLIAINPAKQFGQANDTKRRSDTLQILNTIHQYVAEHSGILPTGLGDGKTVIPTAYIGNGTHGAVADINLCAILTPTYISALPVDPAISAATINGTAKPAGEALTNTECSTAGVTYDSGYQVAVDANGRVTVSAPKAVGTTPISITR
jgi:prepilin-type N-terminal cleavage/methylation domain-containing protein